MPATSEGFVFPDSTLPTGHTRIWEHLENLADSVNDYVLAKSRGEVAYATGPASPAGAVPGADTPFMTLVVPVITGRKYKITAYVNALQVSAPGTSGLYILAPGGAQRWCYYRTDQPTGGALIGTGVMRYVATSTGNVTFTLVAGVAGSGAGVNAGANSCYMLAEVIG